MRKRPRIGTPSKQYFDGTHMAGPLLFQLGLTAELSIFVVPEFQKGRRELGRGAFPITLSLSKDVPFRTRAAVGGVAAGCALAAAFAARGHSGKRMAA